MSHEQPAAEDCGRMDSPLAARGHLHLATEAGGLTPWCGPAALALATGRSYRGACALLRRVAPACYPARAEVVTTYWRDLLAALARSGVPHDPVALPAAGTTLLRLVRGEALSPGWYLLRVTDHFLLLRQHGFGLARLHDNHHTGVVVSGRVHGRRKVTHAVRLLGGPLLAEA
jgi:hypothetical protein